MPAPLAFPDLDVLDVICWDPHSQFFSRRAQQQVLPELRHSNSVVVSEPFSYKHHVKGGDFITLSLGETQASFRVADVYYDYSSERGSILMDRHAMLRYLPDPAPSNLAIYVSPNAQLEAVRTPLDKATARPPVLLFSSLDLP